MRLFKLALAALVVAAPTAAGARLVEQSTRGTKRICVYDTGFHRNNSQSRRQSIAVGIGEPCPHTPRSVEPSTSGIPSMATLRAQRLQRGQRVCVYSDAFASYERAVSIASNCPLTPHF